MSASSIIQQIKGIVTDFVSEDGKILEVPSRTKGYSKLWDGRRLQFMRGFLDLILNTSFTSNVTKSYILDKYISIKGLSEELNNKGFEVNANTLQTKIFRDQKKIQSVFGDRVLLDILHYDNIPMEKYEKALSEAFEKYSDLKLLNNLALKLPQANINSSVTEEEFADFVQAIQPFNKWHMQCVEDGLSKQSVGYIKYLLSSSLLNKVDIERKNIVLQLLGGEQ